jgi:hypothetical protein
VSGHRNHPAAPPPAEPLAALAGRLTAGDRQVCRLLGDHQVLTTGLLALLLDAPPRTLQQRLTTLTTLKVVDRFRPHRPVGAGSAPYHYLLSEAGAAVLAADGSATIDRPGWDRAQLGGLGHANGHLTHLLAVNTVFAQLTHTTRHRAGTRLVCWWPAGRCQARWGRLITPDAYVRWQDPDGEVDFFLHHPPKRQPTSPPSRWRATTSWPPPPASPPPCCCPPAIPTRKPSCETGSPASGCWSRWPPATRPAGRPPTRCGCQPAAPLAAGGIDSAPSAPPPLAPSRPTAAATPAPRTTDSAGAAPTRLKATPGGGRTPPPPPRPAPSIHPNQDQ